MAAPSRPSVARNYEAVTVPANRFDTLRPARVVFELLAQTTNVDVYRSRVDREIVPPDLAQKRITRHHNSWVAHKIGQEIKFFWLQKEWLARDDCFTARQVDGHVSSFE